ncbi:MAG: methylenetetrahydrofolate--tRNA-(uracil(54)-C(5))-methyltransferase (FADH(2)-oxidizing) TrmFO [Armatimonadetes bacterium]|nr:methylenetetrahydrofolate--tRNA-(uracil(54)-C(5))-methyltransferase (FADH(2)-oxidizing) TrmFO [Armatimonadota bacterium]
MFDGVTVIGGGLAGSEAAWQIARRGVPVRLCEMRPGKQTGAHKTANLAELVCSNSFKSNLPHTASGELKREMRSLGSMILEAADEASVPAGEALAVDRELFAASVQSRLNALSSVEIIREEAERIPDEGLVIVATGPLTSEALAADVARITGSERLFFYDAVAPIVETDSIDFDHCWEGSRYDKGDGAYLNCPLSKEQYDEIYEAICSAELAPVHDFEDPRFFEGCLPLEEIARRGPETLAHGPWKPVGLRDPRTGERAHAVVQLRRENSAGTCYSLVACQSRMTWPEQRRIFGMIPALANASWLRLGVVHRNTYLDSPRLLDTALRLRSVPRVAFAGQITGVEGYLESAATGLLTGINAALALLSEDEPFVPPAESMLGALVRYVAESESAAFAPMNANFGILPPVGGPKRRKEDRRRIACDRAHDALIKAAEVQGVLSVPTAPGV